MSFNKMVYLSALISSAASFSTVAAPKKDDELSDVDAELSELMNTFAQGNEEMKHLMSKGDQDGAPDMMAMMEKTQFMLASNPQMMAKIIQVVQTNPELENRILLDLEVRILLDLQFRLLVLQSLPLTTENAHGSNLNEIMHMMRTPSKFTAESSEVEEKNQHKEPDDKIMKKVQAPHLLVSKAEIEGETPLEEYYQAIDPLNEEGVMFTEAANGPETLMMSVIGAMTSFMFKNE